MRIAMQSIAAYAYKTWSRGLFVIFFVGLAGCALPTPPERPTLYDFGPGRLSQSALANPGPATALRPLVIAEIDASPALDSSAVLYRLAYADPQQLKPYALARWSMTPAQLLRQRLRQELGEQRTLLNPGDSAGAAPGSVTPLTLRLELEEFSQLFESPSLSAGLLRLRASVVQGHATGDKTVAQRTFIVQRPAPSADAAGGVRSLTAATDAVIHEIDLWLRALAL